MILFLFLFQCGLAFMGCLNLRVSWVLPVLIFQWCRAEKQKLKPISDVMNKPAGELKKEKEQFFMQVQKLQAVFWNKFCSSFFPHHVSHACERSFVRVCFQIFAFLQQIKRSLLTPSEQNAASFASRGIKRLCFFPTPTPTPPPTPTSPTTNRRFSVFFSEILITFLS